MKTIIAGSRSINDYAIVCQAINQSGFSHKISVVISGEADGVDKLGELWADQEALPKVKFPVSKREWDVHGKWCGYARNARMADYADALIAVWDGESRGTGHMDQRGTHQGPSDTISLGLTTSPASSIDPGPSKRQESIS